mmetsp:Transcript_37374/g.90188  ORF Transcript_37374/g.90188 Transcript_37374/m.90188 type:complete len:96 (+) Transcript_37374:3322-3609(+)
MPTKRAKARCANDSRGTAAPYTSRVALVSGVPATVRSYRELGDESFNDADDADEDEKGERDLDCKMRKLYESYFAELEAFVDMQLCIDSGSNNCF